jgi:hypothetical protein
MSRITVLGAMTVGFTASPNRSHNRTRAHVVEIGQGEEQFAAARLQAWKELG